MSPSLHGRVVFLVAWLLPPVAVAATKGSVVVLGLAGLAGVTAWLAGGRAGFPLGRRLAVLLAVVAAWAGLSAAWAPSPARALGLVLALAGLAAAGCGVLDLVRRLRNGDAEMARSGILIGMAFGALVLAVGGLYATATGQSLWSTFKFDPLTTLNNGAVTLGLLAWPAFAVLWRRGRAGVALAGIGTLYAGFSVLPSGAALVAPAVGGAIAVAVWFGGRRGAVAIGALTALLVVAAPQAVTPLVSASESSGLADRLPPSARHRLSMWAFTVDRIDDRPVLGWGMDSSRAIPGGHRQLAPEVETLPLHPHNAFLQVRLELGLPGAIAAAALAAWLFAGGIASMDDRFARAMAAGTAWAFLTVANLSYGAWQNWWVAFAWCLAALTVLALRPRAPD